MDKEKIIATEGKGWYYGTLPRGCELCLTGEKLVFFMGGDCAHPPHCHWYCPISKERRNSDAYFVNEIKIHHPDQVSLIIQALKLEIEKTEAHGMSFTGGEPLLSPAKVETVVKIIQEIKFTYGKDFHVHLYTSGLTFTSYIADRLEEAGLDEIRFHPRIEDFQRVEFAANRHYSFGAEVPMIPNADHYSYILNLANHLDMIGADFLNLNEFELCEPNEQALREKGFEIAPDSLAAVVGSREYIERFFKEFSPRSSLSIHYCPVTVKDRIQMVNRYIRRANHIKYAFQEVSSEGLLKYLLIEGDSRDIDELETTLHDDSKMPSNLLHKALNGRSLALPWALSEDADFLHLIDQFPLKMGVVESTPFHEDEDGFQICEYTPIQDKTVKKLKRSSKKHP